MKKLFTLFVIMLCSMTLFAKEGGTLTSGTSPIDPSKTVTLTYDGTGTNFANWEPQCFIHTWLIPYEGKSFTKDYGTEWASCKGDADYANLPAKVKMTLISKGKYYISMNIKEFFGVAEEDLEKISDIGVIVRAQYEGDNNQTKDFLLPVEVPGSIHPERPSFYITGDENLVGKANEWNPKAIPVYGETYTIPNVEPGYYEMKITIDGTFDSAKGYADLTGSRRWFVYDVESGNIGIQVGATCDIKVTYNDISFLVEGKLGKQMNTRGQFAWYVAGNFTGNAETDWFAGKTPLTYQTGKGYVGTVHLEKNKEYQFKLVRVGTWPESGIEGSVTAWYTTESTRTMSFDNNIDWVVVWTDVSAEKEPVHLQSTFEGDYTFVVRPDDEWMSAYYDIIYPEDLREKRTITYYPGETKDKYPKYMVHAAGSEGEIGYYTNMTPVEVSGEVSYYTYELPVELTEYLTIVRAPHDVPNWQYLEWGDNGNVWNEAELQNIPLNCNNSWFAGWNVGNNHFMRVFFCGPTSDGYYLSRDGSNWPLYNVDDAHKFTLKDSDKHIYSLLTNLSVGDKLRALEIENLDIKKCYPLPDMDSYSVDAAHAGERTVLFCPNYQSDWSEYGGYLYIGDKQETSIENHTHSGAITKFLRGGQILILRGDKIYTVTGQEVR